jgi:type II secretory pathway pseudopilin PulG
VTRSSQTKFTHSEPLKSVRNTRAFTLIQLIGVMSVLAILASVITPVVAKRVDIAGRDAEATSLAAMSEALVQSSLNTRSIPVATNFAAVIATYLNQTTNAIRANKRGFARVFMADPNLDIGGAGLPFTQTAAGVSTMPAGVRLMFVSTIAKALPVGMTNFDNIWTTPKDTVPTSMSTWGGRGEDLIVERIELGPQFHKLILMNVDNSPAVAIYSIDSSATNSVAAHSRFAAYYMDGTILTMWRPDGVVDFRETLRADTSFVYQNGKWGRQLTSADDGTSDFGQLVDRFLQGPAPCDPGSKATQRAVVNAFYDYLWGYADWAFGDGSASPPIPSFAGSGLPSTSQYPSYSVIYDAQTHLSGNTASFAKNLIE